MKFLKSKISLLLFLIVVITGLLAACAFDAEADSTELMVNDKLTETERKELLQCTWQQLSSGELSEIVGSWEDAVVTSFAVSENESMYYVEPEFREAELFLVTFESRDKELIGNIEKIVEGDSYRIVGYNLRG